MTIVTTIGIALLLVTAFFLLAWGESAADLRRQEREQEARREEIETYVKRYQREHVTE